MKINVRYFIFDYETLEEADYRECTEQEFLEYQGTISYERHTVRENGCSQICLSKGY